MTILIFSFFLFILSLLAGLIGALTGLGGGVILIPGLVLLLHVNIYYAMGASLISVIATSSGAAAAYLKEGYTNLRIAMFLATGAVVGALVGALLVPVFSKTFIQLLFAFVLFISAALMMRHREEKTAPQHSHSWAVRLNLSNKYPVQHVPAAFSMMGVAGCLSGLLGIGSGALNVLAMDQVMKLPYKVAATTSNFIIGITAAASVGVYLANGYIDPGIAFPVLIGVPVGSLVGARILFKVSGRFLRFFFSLVICFLGLQMVYKAVWS